MNWKKNHWTVLANLIRNEQKDKRFLLRKTDAFLTKYHWCLIGCLMKNIDPSNHFLLVFNVFFISRSVVFRDSKLSYVRFLLMVENVQRLLATASLPLSVASSREINKLFNFWEWIMQLKTNLRNDNYNFPL